MADSHSIPIADSVPCDAGQLLERSLVQIHQQGCNRPVQGGNTEEGLVAQAGQTPALLIADLPAREAAFLSTQARDFREIG